MNDSGYVSRPWWLAAVLLAGAAAHGDVTLEQRMRVEGAGAMKLINMSGDMVTTIAGDRARTDSRMQMESRLMRMFGGDATAEIVRLDEEKVYQLDLDDKTYTEATFAEQRAAMQKSMNEMREAQQPQQQGASGVDEESCEWSEPTATVERPGETDEIAGHRAERVVVTATQSCADRDTGQVCDFNLVLDQWLAADFPAGEEVTDYYRRYAAKLGLDVPGSADFAQQLQSMFGRYEGIWQEIATRMEAADGYPLRAAVTLALGGPQCETTPGEAGGAGERPGMREALGGAVGGAIGGLFGRRKDREAEARAKADEAPGNELVPPGNTRIMTISSEIVSVDTAPADRSAFELPADFRPAR